MFVHHTPGGTYPAACFYFLFSTFYLKKNMNAIPQRTVFTHFFAHTFRLSGRTFILSTRRELVLVSAFFPPPHSVRGCHPSHPRWSVHPPHNSREVNNLFRIEAVHFCDLMRTDESSLLITKWWWLVPNTLQIGSSLRLSKFDKRLYRKISLSKWKVFLPFYFGVDPPRYRTDKYWYI